ncbi:MAG: coproporphyrinogen-III oxidase family protein, partial [Cyanobacteria bacterium J06627_15]
MTIPSPRSAYIHIPFCRRRCFYCDFPISVLGERRRGESSGSVAEYVELLLQEIQVTPVLGGPLRTVFFGGGTPSLLSVSQVEQILQALRQRFEIEAAAEISMEMDPGTFDRMHVQGYAAQGVNRVSLGVQSFQDASLAACGRVHRVTDVYRAVADLETAGIENWSLDLISGLPHQTLADWAENLERAIALRPTHLSVYDLTIEPQTPFGKAYQAGTAPLPSDAATV